MQLGDWLAKGAIKYDARNWEKGIPLSVYIASLDRHLCKLMMGEGDEDHAAAIAFNIMGYMHTKEMVETGKLPYNLSDMPCYTKETGDEEQVGLDEPGGQAS